MKVITYFIQTFEEILKHGKTLLYWKGSGMEQELKNGDKGEAARELYLTNSIGIKSNEEALEVMKTQGIAIIK